MKTYNINNCCKCSKKLNDDKYFTSGGLHFCSKKCGNSVYPNALVRELKDKENK